MATPEEVQRYTDAIAHAIVMEIDGDFLALIDGVNMQEYYLRCRHTLLKKYGMAPYPFDGDSYWT